MTGAIFGSAMLEVLEINIILHLLRRVRHFSSHCNHVRVELPFISRILLWIDGQPICKK